MRWGSSCCAARHHALHAFEDEPLVDEARGFKLVPQAAAWLLPHLKAWAGPYYGAWTADFDNS